MPGGAPLPEPVDPVIATGSRVVDALWHQGADLPGDGQAVARIAQLLIVTLPDVVSAEAVVLLAPGTSGGGAIWFDAAGTVLGVQTGLEQQPQMAGSTGTGAYAGWSARGVRFASAQPSLAAQRPRTLVLVGAQGTPARLAEMRAVTFRDWQAALRTLTVFCARGASAVGASSTWPTAQDSFAVVAVPSPLRPSAPVVLRAAQEGPAAELRVARPLAATAAVAGYELYRTREPALAATADFRRLALKSVVTVDNSTWQGAPGSEFALLHDADVQADQRYFYVAVARGPGRGCVLGPRSRPSAVVGVDIGTAPVWIPLPTLAVSGLPTLVRRPAGRLDILVRGSDDRVRAISAEAWTWSEWQLLDGAAPGGTEVASNPAGWATSDTGPDVIAAMPDGSLAHAAPTATGWAPWQAIAGSDGLRAPALAGEGSDLVLAALDSKGQIRVAMGAAGGWSAFSTASQPLAAGPPVVALTAGNVFVATVTADGDCVYTIGSATRWTPWSNLTGVKGMGRPTLLTIPGSGLEILMQAADGALMRRRLSQVMVTPWETVELRPPGFVSAVAVDGALELVSVSAASDVLRRPWLPPLPLDPVE